MTTADDGDTYIPIVIYPPDGKRFSFCVKCNNPCVVGVEEDRDTCIMCLMYPETEIEKN